MIHEQQYQAYRAGLAALNEEQRLAVETIEGPVFVLAGPGTGKTQIMALRVAYILDCRDVQVQPHNILCLTFTEAGAVAMRRRLLHFIGQAAHRITVDTFHGFCNSVIQQNAEYFAFREVQPLSDLERMMILEQLIDELPVEHPLKKLRGDTTYELRRLQWLFTTMKQEHWTPQRISASIDDYLASLPSRPQYQYQRDSKYGKKGSVKQQELEREQKRMDTLRAAAMLFERYEEIKLQKKRYDFQDMILWVLQAFREHEELLRPYQERYQYVLADEFQDTNGAQNELLHLLTDYWEVPNIFCVGDDDQGIYEFQGARLQNMMDFLDRYGSNICRIVLTRNYRSTQPILDICKNVIENNTARLAARNPELSKHLVAARAETAEHCPGPQVLEFTGDVQELTDVVNRIEALHRSGTPWSEIAVLYYRNNEALPLMPLLDARRIPYRVNRPLNLLELPVVQQWIDLLTYIQREHIQPFSSDALLFAIMHQPWFGLRTIDTHTFAFQASRTREAIPWRRLLNDDQFLTSVPISDPEAWHTFARRIEQWIGDGYRLTLPMLVEHIIREAGILRWVLQQPDKDWYLQVLSTFFDLVVAESGKGNLLTLADFIEYIDHLRRYRLNWPLQRIFGDDQAVVLSTCHSAKGLEFDYVFLINCSDQGWEKAPPARERYALPDTLTLTGEEQSIESLRRLFYVGCSRSRKGLYLSYSLRNRDGKEKIASQFIAETRLTPQRITVEKESTMQTMASYFDAVPVPVPERIEQRLIQQRLENFALSPSALDAYLDCPVRFYYEYILRIPAAPHESMAYGSAIHLALERLFKKMKKAGNRFPPVQEFLDDFSAAMVAQRAMFTDRQFAQRMQLGQHLLRQYFEYYASRWNTTVLVEFMVKEAEVHGVPIKGKIDKLEFSGYQVNVVDYKTGTYKNALRLGKLNEPNEHNPYGGSYWRQMVFYKLLLNNYQARGWEVTSCTFDFIDTDETGTFTQHQMVVQPEDERFVADLISQTYQQIMAHGFYQGCGKPECGWCALQQEQQSDRSLSLASATAGRATSS